MIKGFMGKGRIEERILVFRVFAYRQAGWRHDGSGKVQLRS